MMLFPKSLNRLKPVFETRYMIDLLFGEETVPMTLDPDLWHRELDAFIDSYPC